MKQNYEVVVLPDGSFNLIESDKTDLQEYIDSFAESVSIEHIMAMCAAGDTSVLSKTQGAYLDTTVMPKTYRDMLDTVINGRAKFDALPVDVKQKFDNDFQKWFSDAGSPEWIKKMGFIQESIKSDGEVESDAE